MKEQDPAELEQILLGQSNAKENAPSGAMREPREDPTQVVHLSVEHLHGPEEVTYGTGELVVVCLVRDGRAYINSYVEHYLSLGAKHLIFLDNNSTDGTVETLKGYDNVTVLRTTLPYKNPKRGRGGTESLFNVRELLTL